MKLTTQQTYDAYSSALFEHLDDVKAWPVIVTDKQDANREVNINYFKKHLNLEVANYELRRIPTHAMRNTWDSAKLLVITTVGGKQYAKRHNNSQWLSIEE